MADRSCASCGGSMTGKKSHAVYCTRKCKAAASQQRRVRDDAARYQVERDRRIAYALDYAKRNPHVGQAAKRRRKAKLAEAGVFEFTSRQWRRTCNRAGGRCFYCHEVAPLTMDHVIPVVRGGRHSEGNIVPACARCNSSKRARLIIEWRRGGGRRAVEAA